MATKKQTIRIGNAGGYWGDDPHALERQVRGGHLDYISIDFLAEITMSIMQKQRASNPDLGYAKDFIPMLRPVLKDVLKNKTKIITNAGGVNPQACAHAIQELAASLGVNPKIAVVYGDDLMSDLATMREANISFDNMETGSSFDTIADRIEAANVYFGAKPVVEALKWDPDIVITGRVTDTGITVAAMMHEFGWKENDWDKIASGIIAGHMMECGTQVTGGNFTDWHLVPSFDKVGFPIAEVNADGTFVLTKHPNTGGLVSYDTVREQVFYEMGDPKAYITPDVVADFSSIKLQDLGNDRVQVSGIRGYEPTQLYKVSMAYRDGFKSVGSIIISGPNARAKAEAFSDIFWKRAEGPFLETETEYFGWNACQRSLGHKSEGNEILLRLGARAETKEELYAFGKLIPSLILSGPPGVAVTGGVPKPQTVVSYWPALMPKSAIQPRIARFEDGKILDECTVETCVSGNFKPEPGRVQLAKTPSQPVEQALSAAAGATELVEICLGRSGDKGDTCNIGVLARGEKSYAWLEENLTAQVVKDWFQELCHGEVERYALPGLLGFNFLLAEALGGGGTKTMRSDAQGKTFAQALLRQKMVIPDDVLAEARAYNEARKK